MLMADDKLTLLRQRNGLLGWVHYHCETMDDLARALYKCDYTMDEIANELAECGATLDEALSIFNTTFDSELFDEDQIKKFF